MMPNVKQRIKIIAAFFFFQSSDDRKTKQPSPETERPSSARRASDARCDRHATRCVQTCHNRRDSRILHVCRIHRGGNGDRARIVAFAERFQIRRYGSASQTTRTAHRNSGLDRFEHTQRTAFAAGIRHVVGFVCAAARKPDPAGDVRDRSGRARIGRSRRHVEGRGTRDRDKRRKWIGSRRRTADDARASRRTFRTQRRRRENDPARMFDIHVRKLAKRRLRDGVPRRAASPAGFRNHGLVLDARRFACIPF